MKEIKEIAEQLHNEYEKYAKEVGWKTQESTQVYFDDLPEANKKVMLKMAEYINSHYIAKEKVKKVLGSVRYFDLPCEWWANEGGKRIRFTKLHNGDVRISFCNIENKNVYAELTLASYRWEDTTRELSEIYKKVDDLVEDNK